MLGHPLRQHCRSRTGPSSDFSRVDSGDDFRLTFASTPTFFFSADNDWRTTVLLLLVLVVVLGMVVVLLLVRRLDGRTGSGGPKPA